MSAGHITFGASVSVTVTLNVLVTELPLASVARHVTTFVPFANVEPEGGTQTSSTWLEQLSNAVALKFTTAVQLPRSVDWVIFGGSEMVGACLSSTVTVKEQEALFPEGSVAVHVTVLVPTGKLEPEGGTQV